MRGEQGDEFLVGLQEIVIGQRGGIGPLEPFKHQILQRGGAIDAGLKENQFKFRPEFAVAMPGAKKFPADRGLDPQFFAKFARQGLLREFRPASIFPPGNSHCRAWESSRRRWQTRILESRRISAATTVSAGLL